MSHPPSLTLRNAHIPHPLSLTHMPHPPHSHKPHTSHTHHHSHTCHTHPLHKHDKQLPHEGGRELWPRGVQHVQDDLYHVVQSSPARGVHPVVGEGEEGNMEPLAIWPHTTHHPHTHHLTHITLYITLTDHTVHHPHRSHSTSPHTYHTVHHPHTVHHLTHIDHTVHHPHTYHLHHPHTHPHITLTHHTHHPHHLDTYSGAVETKALIHSPPLYAREMSNN